MKRVFVEARPTTLAAGLVALVLLAASCTAQPVILPSQDFDRPMDMTFVCVGTFEPGAATSDDGGVDAGGSVEAGAPAASGTLIASGRPMRECHPRGTVDVSDPNHTTFAFVPNSSSGELSVIDADKWSLVNLDPENPGFNRLPLGVLPSQIASSDDGCRLVTANHGSCDLSFVDPSALLAPTLSRAANTMVTATGSTIVTNVIPRAKNSGRELHVLAGEVTFLPMGTIALTQGENLCSGDPSQQWQALATFPSCDLVALIDLPSGVIQKAAYARKTASGDVALVPLADGEDPVCPVDCLFPSPDASTDGGPSDGGAAPPAAEAGSPEAGASEAGASDAGASDAGTDGQGAPQNSEPGDVPYVGPGALRPGPIAIIPENGRAFVGLANAAFVLAFNVDQNQLVVPAGGGAIPLHEGALGVDRVRLSIDPYKDKTVGGVGIAGSFVGDDPALDPTPRPFVADRQYLYVVARDGSLRVVQVAHVPETECETNLDFTTAANQQKISDACPAVVGAAVRRPGVIGPGIRLPTPPVDIAVADVRPTMPDKSETSVSGAHAWVLTANGAVYLVNIDPVTRNIFYVLDTDMAPVLSCTTPSSTDCFPEPDPPPNSLRNRGFVGFTLALDPSSGPARLDIPPAQLTIGPRIESVWTRGSANNATALSGDYIKTQVYFPDQTTVTPQSWAVSWEGNLMANPRSSGQLQTDPSAGSSSLVDLGMDFCRLGVQERDIVTLEGCTNTSQCNIGQECVLGSNGAQGAGGLPITGLCLPSTLPANQCDDLLSTVKRYDVTSANQTVLGLLPHKDELVRPTLKPCTFASASAGGGTDAGSDGRASDARDAGGDGGAPTGLDDCVDPLDPSTATFQCVEDHRCLDPCEVAGETEGCRTGRICVPFGPRPVPKAGAGAGSEPCDTQSCYCADAPLLSGPYASKKVNVSACLGELLPYQVGVGRGFLVSGSQTSLPTTGTTDTSGACVPLPNLDVRTRIRIPMDAPACPSFGPTDPTTLDSRCDPNVVNDPRCPTSATTAHNLATILETPNDPNPCQFMGGPNETDEPNAVDPTTKVGPPRHVHALFRNRELQFMMTNLERPPSGVFQILFNVHGGFQPQTVAIPTTVEVSMPARLILGPFDANNPVMGTPGAATGEVPYLFVVDQRRLGLSQGGGPTRGQLLRIHPRGFAITTPVLGNQPWYEDLNNSANLFPIQ